MLKISAKKLSQILNGTLYGDDGNFTGVAIDTRELSGEEVFFALRGEKTDGHNYITPTMNGQLAIVEKPVDFHRYIIVQDTLKALGDLASFYRSQFQPLVFGITGSNGKTTTKEMLNAILGTTDSVLATQGNFNNEIGMPLTLFQLTEAHKYLVLEMGMRGRGQIEYLAHIAKPHLGIITYIGEVHTELLGNRDNIAKAKGELLLALPKEGVSIIPRESEYYEYLKGLHKNSLSFGISGDVYAENISFNEANCASFLFCYKKEKIPISLSLPGKHNINNALAAGAAAICAGISLDNISLGLETTLNLAQRMAEIRKGSLIIIDDTYNASPTSMKAALNHLVARAKNLGLDAYAALGDMKELGDDSKGYHREIGELAAQLNLKELYLYGKEMEEAAKSAREHGLEAVVCSSHQEIATKVSSLKGILLLKGSRSQEMEKVITYLA